MDENELRINLILQCNGIHVCCLDVNKPINKSQINKSQINKSQINKSQGLLKIIFMCLQNCQFICFIDIVPQHFSHLFMPCEHFIM